MISLRKYLEAAEAMDCRATAEFCQALADLSAALLAGVEDHILERDLPQLGSYPDALRSLREHIEADPSPQALRAAGASARALLEQHHQLRAELHQRQGTEIANIVAMLNQTVAVLSGGSERSITRLRKIEEDLKAASAISDIVALKDRLGDTLRFVREQNAREREDSKRTLAEMERNAQRAQERMAIARSGVPDRSQAEQALAGVVVVEDPARLLVVIVLERAAAIRERFGSVVAERFVYLFVQDLVEQLPCKKKLFRWTENSLLMEVEPSGSPEATRSLLRSAMGRIPAERRIDVGQRLAVFSNQHRWTAIPAAELRDGADMAARLDQLVST
jgi:hypothetical protein